MNKKLKFQCWNCPKTYYQTAHDLNLNVLRRAEEKLIVRCPYCHAEAVVDLRPYGKAITVLKGDEDKEPILGDEPLPDILPTQEPE